jgi:hypothetical protein
MSAISKTTVTKLRTFRPWILNEKGNYHFWNSSGGNATSSSRLLWVSRPPFLCKHLISILSFYI